MHMLSEFSHNVPEIEKAADAANEKENRGFGECKGRCRPRCSMPPHGIYRLRVHRCVQVKLCIARLSEEEFWRQVSVSGPGASVCWLPAGGGRRARRAAQAPPPARGWAAASAKQHARSSALARGLRLPQQRAAAACAVLLATSNEDRCEEATPPNARRRRHWRQEEVEAAPPPAPATVAAAYSSVSPLAAISFAPSSVLFPPMNPAACTNTHPGIPVSPDRASSLTPRHAFGSCGKNAGDQDGRDQEQRSQRAGIGRGCGEKGIAAPARVGRGHAAHPLAAREARRGRRDRLHAPADGTAQQHTSLAVRL